MYPPQTGTYYPRPQRTKGIAPTIIGGILTLLGLIGVISVAQYASRPFNTFVFGGGSGWFSCASCEMYTGILVLSVPALLAGIILVIVGLISIASSNKHKKMY